MKKLAIAFAIVLSLVGFASTASAQGYRGHGGHNGRGGVGISINTGHRGVGVGIYVGGGYPGGYRHGGDIYSHYPRGRAYGYPVFRGGRYFYDDRYYDNYPDAITVTVYEYRQVRGYYGWENVEVPVRVVAYWDSYYGAYVYRDSYGRQHVID